MSEANWPIRVGGEYRSSRYPESQYARVTAIDGQIIYLERLREDGAQHTFPADDMVAGAFRRCYRPEDQSLLSEMSEALKGLRDALPQSGLTTTYGSPLMFAVLKANAVIAKAETRASALTGAASEESPEVRP